jgi:hypothetical protein
MSLMRMQGGIIGGSFALGPTPAFGAAGTASGGNVEDVTPGYPAGITAGQLLILQVESTNIVGAPSTPAGWTLQWDDQRSSGGGNAIRQWVYSTYATGSESGTLTVDFPSAGNKGAVIIRITNPHASSPFEGATLVRGTDDPVNGPTLTPAGPNRLGLALIAVGDNQAAETAISGATGGTWTSRVANTHSSGADSALFLNSVDLSSGGQISGGSFSPAMVTAADWLCRAVMLKPSGA